MSECSEEERDPVRALVERRAKVMKDATQSEDELKYSRKRRAQELPAFVDASDSEDESGSTDSKETDATEVTIKAPKGVVIVDEAVPMDEEILIALRAPRYYDPEDLTIDTAPKCYRCGEQGHVARNCTGAATSKPCYLCAETGHEANSCPNTVCFKCGQRGHQMRDCPSAEGPTPCMRCGDPTCGAIGAGDAFRDPSVGCQRVPSEEDLSRAICVVCGAKGHLCCVSWMPDFATPSCFNCGEEGHTGMECDEPRPRGADVVLAGPGRSYREAHAFRLRLAQEWGNDDELDDQGYDRAGGSGRGGREDVQCFKCGNYGHMARDCPGGDAGRGGGYGHGYGRHGHGGVYERRGRGDEGWAEEPALTCYRCGGVGHLARDCASQPSYGRQGGAWGRGGRGDQEQRWGHGGGGWEGGQGYGGGGHRGGRRGGYHGGFQSNYQGGRGANRGVYHGGHRGGYQGGGRRGRGRYGGLEHEEREYRRAFQDEEWLQGGSRRVEYYANDEFQGGRHGGGYHRRFRS